MRYMLLIYTDEVQHQNPSIEQFRANMTAHQTLMAETGKKGILGGAQPLKPSTTATTVRMSTDGKFLVTDGPFAETKEQLAGYYLLDCKDLDEAIGYASRIPMDCAGGGVRGVEIRPILEFSELQQRFEAMLSAQHA